MKTTKNVWNKSLIVGMTALFAAFGLVTAGCASYKGQYDRSVPMAEQSILIIPQELSVTSIDGNPVKWFAVQGNLSISIPSGEHTFKFNYYSKVLKSSSPTIRTYTVSTASGMTASAIFVPGGKHEATAHISDNMVSVTIDGRDSNNGKGKSMYVGPEILTGFSAGMDLASVGGMGCIAQMGVVIDSKFTQAVHFDLGIDLGGAKDMTVGFDVYMGGLYEIYIPGTSVGFGIGGGVASAIFDASNSKFFLLGSANWIQNIPYIRGTIIPFRNMTKLNVYFDYYLNKKKMNGTAANDWGVGVLWLY